MKLAVIGSRTWPVPKGVFDQIAMHEQARMLRDGAERVKVRTLKALKPGDSVISGGARGPDMWGAQAASAAGYFVDVILANWDDLGKGAGFARNTTIAEGCDGALAFWDGQSRGTLDTMTKVAVLGRPVVAVYGDGREELWSKRYSSAQPTHGRVVHCLKDSFDVYIGRTSHRFLDSGWGNPFVVGRDGTRTEVVERHGAWILEQPELLARIGELRGKVLGCWCAPLACHGDTLAVLADRN